MTDQVRVAARMAQIAPFHVMEIVARAQALEASGRHIVHMEVGEPDFVTAPPIIAAGQAALAQGRTGYTCTRGIPELRLALSRFYQEYLHAGVDPDHILLTPGASGALQLVTGVLVDPGDQVLMADPGYPCNRHFVRFVNGEPVPIPVDAGTGFQLTAELVERHWGPRTVAVLVASPSNPTGTLIDPGQLRAIIALAASRGARVIVDEIYQGLCYGQAAESVLRYSDEVLVVNSFSKYFGMTGWRLGWLVAPAGYQRALETLAQNLFIAPSTLAQYAALAAFSDQSLRIQEQRREQFRLRRDYLVAALETLGFGIAAVPRGAFYVYADCSAFCDNSEVFAKRLLSEAGVAITPGVDFGSHRADQHLRFAYTTSMSELEEGVRRLQSFLAA